MNYNKELEKMYKEVESLIEETRYKIYKSVNKEMVLLYWTIGKTIMNLQEGKSRAQYGRKLLEDLSNMLTIKYGKGFSKRNLERMRQFYNLFPIAATLSPFLSWSYYKELIKIKDKNERNFYMLESINSNWDVRTLQRQRKSCLYERLLLGSEDEKRELLPFKGQVLERGRDIVKDPYILEFLKLETNYKESDLEKSIIRVYVGTRERIYVCWKSDKDKNRWRRILCGFSVL